MNDEEAHDYCHMIYHMIWKNVKGSKNHIKMIQDTYQESYHSSPQLTTRNNNVSKHGYSMIFL